MKKKQLYLFSIMLVWAFFLAACTPGIDLSGAAGGDGNDGGDDGGTAGQAASNSSGGGGQAGASDSSANTEAINFYAPRLSIIVSGNTTTTGLSSPPISAAEYQATSPKTLQIGQEKEIKLTLVPDALRLNKVLVFQEVEENITYVFQGKLNVYPYMNAEILTGDAFSVKPNSSVDQIINLEKATTWLWYITALQAGEHTVVLNISVPAQVGEVMSKYELAHIEIPVHVPGVVVAVPTMTLTPVPPTPTPIPSLSSQLAASASGITIALITVAGTIVVALIARQSNKDKKEKKQQVQAKKDWEERSKNIQKKTKDDIEESKRKVEESKKKKKEQKE